MVRWAEEDPGAGEVDELTNLARRVDTLAEQLWHTGQDVWATADPVSEEAWAGQAGDQWREQVEQALPPPLQTVVDVAVDTAEALTTYARHVGEIASEAAQARARHEDATAAGAAAMAQLTQSAPPKPPSLGVLANQPATGPLMKELADMRRIANARLDDAHDDQRAAERAMEELVDRRRSADRRVIEALGPVEVGEWEHIGQAVITAGFTSLGHLGKVPMGAAMMRLSAGVYSGTADQATADMAVAMAYRLMAEWMKSRDPQKVIAVGRDHPSLLNTLLASVIAAKKGRQLGFRCRGVVTGVRGGRASKEVAEALSIIYFKFKPNGRWDAKPHLAEQFGVVNDETGWLPTSTGQKVYYDVFDVFGKIQYGGNAFQVRH